MKRAILGLALTSSAVTMALLALVYGFDSHLSSATAIDPKGGDAKQSQQTSPIDMELNNSAVVKPRSSDGSQEQVHANQNQPQTMVFSPDGGIADEDATSEGVRKEATNDVRRRYALLLQDLDLTPREREALFAFLIEDRIASTSTPYKLGKTIDKEEQSMRIAAIIGDHKLQQFRELESNLGAYAEVHNIGSLLQTNGVPLTNAQRDRLLKVVVETQDRSAVTPPPAEVDPSSIEFLERQLTQRAEYERHLMELAPSVLSAQQVVYLDQQYQYLSYMRANSLERQRQERADGSRAKDSPLSFTVRVE